MTKKQTKEKEPKFKEVTKEDVVMWKKMIDTVVKNEKGIIYICTDNEAAGLVRNTNKYELISRIIDGFEITPDDLIKVMMIDNLK